MIRFGLVASVVSAAVALLIIGALSGDLALVYVSIGLAGLALVMLVIGVAVWRDKVFASGTPAGSRQAAADQHARVHPVAAPAAAAPAASPPAAPVQSGPVRAAPAGAERRDRERDPRRPAPAGPRPAAVARPGRQRDTVATDWTAVGRPEDVPERELSRSAGRAPRGPESSESPRGERHGAAEPPGRRPAGTEQYPPDEQPEPADDPTRLAHKLGIGRDASPDTGFPAPPARPAEAATARRMLPDLAPESAAEQRSSAEPQAVPRAAGSPASRTLKPDKQDAPPEPVRASSETAAAAPEPAGTVTDPPGSPSAPPPPGATAAAGPAAAPAAADVVPASAGATAAAGESAAEPAPAASEAASPQPAAADGAAGEAVQDSAGADAEVLVVPGIARFHQADCILIRFLGEDDLRRMSRGAAKAAGCVACRACRP